MRPNWVICSIQAIYIFTTTDNAFFEVIDENHLLFIEIFCHKKCCNLHPFWLRLGGRWAVPYGRCNVYNDRCRMYNAHAFMLENLATHSLTESDFVCTFRCSDMLVFEIFKNTFFAILSATYFHCIYSCYDITNLSKFSYFLLRSPLHLEFWEVLIIWMKRQGHRCQC